MFDLDKTHPTVNARADNRRDGFEFGGEDREIIFKHDVAGNLTFLNKVEPLNSPSECTIGW